MSLPNNLIPNDLSLFDLIVTPMWLYDVENYRVCWANQSALSLWNARSVNELCQRDLSHDITKATDHQLQQLAKESRLKHSAMWWTLYPNNQPKQVYIRFSNISSTLHRNLLLCESVISREDTERDTSFVAKGNTITSLFDQHGQFLSGNLKFTTTYQSEEVDLAELLEMPLNELAELMHDTNVLEVERQVIVNGRICWFNFIVKWIHSDTHYLVTQEDITKHKTRENTYKHLAFHDQLTGLLNRNGLKDFMDEYCKEQLAFRLFLLDLDGFKFINNHLGHVAGDKALQVISQRLLEDLSPDYTICRFGGDEFIVITPITETSPSVDKVSSEIAQLVATPIKCLDSIQITTSIGAATFPYDAVKVESLIMYADTAMHKAKEQGSTGYAKFIEPMSIEIQRKSAIQQGLRNAINNDQLTPLYQPIVDIESGELVGMEALLSWNSPILGTVNPHEFVPEAERSGTMNEIGQWILKKACQQCVQWQQLTGKPLKLSVNVSATQLNDEFSQMLGRTLKETGLDAKYLSLELTESIFMLNIHQIVKRLRAICQHGVKLCIDDFGTGYSSLAYIHELPINTIKIDRSFITNIDKSQIVVEATIAMANKLGLHVIVEGIESKHHQQVMAQYPDLLAQGFFYSRPVTIHEFVQLPLFTNLLEKTSHNDSVILFSPRNPG
ncbi:bifunctional diguanylate cyclase/phosphodiesterase [Psychrobium sp. 1_MG-2023]|uniref:putative bifunctional diguanylate cyclase/phosphodiesterase n=1 Tax=Psychrobium sp. 1_MG-2023 TaxID=3062624 RepID=UPI0026B76DA4|nr:EAL domain-containing protein [Psychrobium sp. 1_MG-2023]MDP2561885.1 EAL domain-containing protein [Psychrobium sp. 1_MG-2023]